MSLILVSGNVAYGIKLSFAEKLASRKIVIEDAHLLESFSFSEKYSVVSDGKIIMTKPGPGEININHAYLAIAFHMRNQFNQKKEETGVIIVASTNEDLGIVDAYCDSLFEILYNPVSKEFNVDVSIERKGMSLNRWSRWFFDMTESDSGVITLSNPQKLS